MIYQIFNEEWESEQNRECWGKKENWIQKYKTDSKIYLKSNLSKVMNNKRSGENLLLKW